MADSKSNETAKTDESRKVPELTFSRLGMGEHKRNVWHVDIPVNTEPNDLVAVAYWSNIAHRLRQFDIIECWCEDSSWFAECRVLDAGHNWAKVAVMRSVKLDAFDPQQRFMLLPGHRVEFAGNFAKWRVIRESDAKVLRDKCLTESDAYTWLAEYAKSVTKSVAA